MSSSTINPRNIAVLLIVLSVTTFVALLQVFYEYFNPIIRYDSLLIKNGEWWRLLSGHFIHLSWTHLLLNLIGLWVIFFIFYHINKPIPLIISLALIPLSISFCLLVFNNEVIWYVGLSGVLHGLIILGALTNIRLQPWPSVILIGGVTAKLIWEQVYENNSLTEPMIGGKIIQDAHLYGAISGGILFLIFSFHYIKTKTPD